ncbi:unnamed protein product [Spirodela intermedia]|uniref:EF-hand domain-containing protein n=2 Tax=Spirodela intermedia TaxID=51605 RepID=A0A7I8L962_SPIIN|nr:unnamed protein product [Spirodela intermedia]CAA6669219.1 unnamed protein product [Spirodela intermedia]CAA7406166.1 unnamed protein product [Spirodela intermedia]
MEEAKETLRRRGLGEPAPSFRLRSPSLNVLRLRRIFDLFDQNGDGVITAAELRQVLRRLGLEEDASDLNSAVEAFLRPGHAGLEFGDFEDLHRSLGNLLFGDLDGGAVAAAAAEEEEDMAEAFKVFDEDGDGFISAVELLSVLRKLGLAEGGNLAAAREMIRSVDANHDGLVDFSEFRQMMRKIPSSSL